MNKYDKLLEWYCQQHDGYTHSKWTYEPRPYNDNIFATNKLILIRIAKRLVEGEYHEEKYQPHTGFDNIFPKNNCSLSFPVMDIVAKIKNIPHSETIDVEGDAAICEECKGNGIVEWQYESKEGELHQEYFKCPVCDGAGKFQQKTYYYDDRNIEINGLWFRVGNIIKILESLHQFGCDLATVTHIAENKAMIINVEPGVDILAMPNKLTKPAQSITLKPTES